MKDIITIRLKAFGIKHTPHISESSDTKEFIEICTMMAESVGFSPGKVIEALKIAISSRE
ncbi:MAG: hypothetical protein H6Q12_621 [Bacteroidetes bacterium]|nr:hypothetical protein [Bacteroidota bacterium]